MCGLVGVLGTIDKIDNNIFKDLLRVDVLRGPHSTGIASRERLKPPVLFKKALLPDDLFSMKQAKDLFNEFNRNDILMGHNRWATAGKINHTNAHPFEMDRIIGAHNGTLRKQHLLPDHSFFEVDSENIFHSFEKLGVKETIKLLDGAFALTWFDKNTDVFNFCRNDERSLFYCFSEKGKTFYYASEDWMLEGVLARHKVAHQGILPFEDGYHYKLKLPHQGQPFAKNSFTMVEVEEYEPPKSTNRWNAQRIENHQKAGNRIIDNVTDINTAKKKSLSTTQTDGGTSDARPYENGDDIFFVIRNDPPGAKFLVGRDVSNHDRLVNVYVPRGSVVRKQMLAADVQTWWRGVVNDCLNNGTVVVQGNSVQTYDDYCDEQGWTDAEETTCSTQEDSAWERHVELISAIGRCGWCNEELSPTENNHIENAHTAICPGCVKLPEVQDFITLQKEIPF